MAASGLQACFFPHDQRGFRSIEIKGLDIDQYKGRLTLPLPGENQYRCGQQEAKQQFGFFMAIGISTQLR